MKAGIVTITNGPPNFGNILQTYAVQQSLKKLNIDSEVIRNYSFAEYRKNKLYLIPKLTCCANLFRCICKLRKGKNPLLLLVGRLSAKR